MVWNAGNFTRANGSTEWQDDAALGLGIEPGLHDAQDNDLATGIDQCLNKTGQNAMTGNLNVGGNRVTNVASGTAAAPAICAGNDVDTGIFSPAANELAVSTNGVERVRINSVGSVGIGVSNPGVLLDLRRDANNTLTRVRLHNADAGSSAQTHIDLGNNQNQTAAGLILNSSTNTANGGVSSLNLYNGVGPISLNINSSEKIRLATNNDVILRNGQLFFDSILSSGAGTHFVKWNSINGLVTYDSSSALIKEQIVDCPYGLNTVAAMQPRRYYRKDDKRHEVGFIADELIAVTPELVNVGAKSLVTNNAADTEQIPVSVSYEKLTAILCKAIQELSAKVEALEARLPEVTEPA
jgi:hypothetical protein